MKESERLSEINLNSNPKVKDKITIEVSRKNIRPFQETDWYGWGGAEKLPSGSDPYIWEDDDYTLLVTGTENDDRKAVVSIYDEDYEMYSFESKPMSEDEALRLGDQIAGELSSGRDCRKIVRQNGFVKVEY